MVVLQSNVGLPDLIDKEKKKTIKQQRQLSWCNYVQCTDVSTIQLFLIML